MTGYNPTFARFYVALATISLIFSACGDDDGGDGDTLLTGFSGLVIFFVVVWLIVRAVKKRG